MVGLPDGSVVWLECNGEPMIEYAHQAEEDDKLNTHTTSVYVAAKKGEFQVCFNLGYPGHTSRQVKIAMDGHPAATMIRKARQGEKDVVCAGWQISPTTTRRFTFVDLDTSEDGQLGSSEHNQKLLETACIQVSVVDAICIGLHRQPVKFAQLPPDENFHPSSDVCKHVGCQVKPGIAVEDVAAGYRHRPKRHRYEPRWCSRVYSVRFLYRSEQYLIEKDMILAPGLDEAQSKKKEKESGAASVEADLQAEDGQGEEEDLQRQFEAELLAIRQMSDGKMDMSID